MAVTVGGVAGAHAAALLHDLGAVAQLTGEQLVPPTPGRDWAASGAMHLTGFASGPPMIAPGASTSAVRGALLVLAELTWMRTRLRPMLPGPELLGERAALAGLHRRAPWSPGGGFRCLAVADGWLGVSLARADDAALVPAIVQEAGVREPWLALAEWAAGTDGGQATERAQLLGVPAAVVPDLPGGYADPQSCARDRHWLTSHAGGPRSPGGRVPLVVDLTSLWAGPLCARLLRAAGCRVVKVETPTRPDGARAGPSSFFDLMHAGSQSIALDLDTSRGREDLWRLVSVADVVLEASRPRALAQLGVDAATVVSAGTTWLSITAYGRDGPWANRVGFGDDVAAAAGLVARSDDGAPVTCGDALADPLAGVHAAVAVAAALLDDRAHLLDVSMRDVVGAAARLPSPEGHVRRVRDGWLLTDPTGSSRVELPRAPVASGPGPALGANTAAVLTELL